MINIQNNVLGALFGLQTLSGIVNVNYPIDAVSGATVAISMDKIYSEAPVYNTTLVRSSDSATSNIAWDVLTGLYDIASAEAFVTTGDGSVSRWNCQDGTANYFRQATANQRPYLIEGGVNNNYDTGKPAIRFAGSSIDPDGVSNSMTLYSGTANVVIPDNNFTLFLDINHSLSSSGRIYVQSVSDGANTGWAMGDGGSGYFKMTFVVSGTPYTWRVANFSVDTPLNIIVTWNGTAPTVSYNGVDQTVSVNATHLTVPTSNGFVISGTASPFKLKDLIYYPSILTPEQIATVSAYL